MKRVMFLALIAACATNPRPTSETGKKQLHREVDETIALNPASYQAMMDPNTYMDWMQPNVMMSEMGSINPAAFMNPARYQALMNPNSYMAWMNPAAYTAAAQQITVPAYSGNWFDMSAWTQFMQPAPQPQAGKDEG